MRTWIGYLVMAAAAVFGVLLLLQLGGGMSNGVRTTAAAPKTAAALPLGLILIQIVVTVLVARSCSAGAKRLGQPAVIGEMIGGIALGPTLFGLLFPGAFHALFPPGSMTGLRLLADVAVVLFMFTVGLDVDLSLLRQRTHAAIVISHASIAVPFILGVAFALFLFPSYAAGGTSFAPFALFVGIAMSITAFPVLARILSERGLSGTPAGTMALTCAAVDDITAWCLLALVTAVARAQQTAGAAIAAASIAFFALVMVKVVRPILARFPLGESGSLMLLFASAAVTEWIGVHALFGAFLAGTIIPRDAPARDTLRVRLATMHRILLPLFFAYTGIRTNVELLHDSSAWLVCLTVIALATAGKLGGSALTARLTGSLWPDALTIGALMNTRGLVELIALNVGYDLGIIRPELFAIMVVMALVTTIATAPLLSLLKRAPAAHEPMTEVLQCEESS